MKKNIFALILITLVIIFSSCGKGYEVRVSNYNTEILDSVIIGKDVVFKQLELQATTDYRKLSHGEHAIKFITKTKKVFTSSITISRKGGGKRTVQIDGVNSISILED